MSSPSLHPGQQPHAGAEWARLIPGRATPTGKKKPQRVAGVPAFLAVDAFSARSGKTAEDAAHPRSSVADVPRQTRRNWLRAALAGIARLLRSGAALAARWAEKGEVRRREAAASPRNVLIVGAGGLGQRIATYLGEHPELGLSVCGLLDDRRPTGRGVIGHTSELAQWARTQFVDEVILAGPHDREKTLWVLRESRQLRLDVKIAPDLFGCVPTGTAEHIGGIPLISLHEERAPVLGLSLKRALDVTVSAAALVVLAPLLVLLAIVISADSRGSVLYTALRVGRKGRPFHCYKFRTMLANADELKKQLRDRNRRQGPFFKITDDPRITRVGKFLRRYSLDELPQLFNVLRGEMSLVGPRPHPLDDFSGYSIQHLPRLDVTPGITGLWQVTARRNPSFQTGMELDLEYIHGWSLAMDLKILFKTAAAVWQGNGE